MTNTPKCIWIDPSEGYQSCSFFYDEDEPGDVEYVRLDLVEALEAENRRLRKALEHIEQLAGAVGVDLQGRVEGGKVAAVLNCRNIARAALRSTEAIHD